MYAWRFVGRWLNDTDVMDTTSTLIQY